ncbi:MAG: tRNA (guanosine(46)-N7)-methyltransferase TrmB [Bacteroidetes bacterium]|nr:MAG: tRNA (guanosine(46)-N7)-methyltransferase TrmB [Bacteroidota bacterium]
MAKNKLRRFREMEDFPNCLQPELSPQGVGDFEFRGKWRSDYFKNDHPIVLELGCGKGEYAVGLARKYPNKNFIGVDIKGARMWVGAREALEENLNNVSFLRTKIDFIAQFFEPNEVDEIWLTFSDPQPAKPRKRLTSRLFIERYMKLLKPGGVIHLKTDSDLLFESTLEQIEEHAYPLLECSWDLYGELPEDLDETTREILEIKTHYEQLFTARGSVIKYLRFQIH